MSPTRGSTPEEHRRAIREAIEEAAREAAKSPQEEAERLVKALEVLLDLVPTERLYEAVRALLDADLL